MEREYKFRVYQNRRGHEDTYKIKKTETGWYVSHISINGEADATGFRTLFMNLDHDSITYPNKIGDFMSWLWEQADQNLISEDEIQTKLQELADWISITEKSEPKWSGWNA